MNRRRHDETFKMWIAFMCISMFALGASFGYYWAAVEASRMMRNGFHVTEIKREAK